MPRSLATTARAAFRRLARPVRRALQRGRRLVGSGPPAQGAGGGGTTPAGPERPGPVVAVASVPDTAFVPAGGEPDRPRLFGIGLNKTGTSSLHEALTLLGYNSLHWGGPPIQQRVEQALAAGEPLVGRLDPAYDAFSDIEPLATNFALLDEQYPGSRFVLTVRPVDDWVESRRRHVENNVRRRAAGEYDGDFLEVREPDWRRHWNEHLAAARAYFDGRHDFLEVDITADWGWSGICALLGVPEPDVPFPWAHRYRRYEDGHYALEADGAADGEAAPRQVGPS